MPKPSKPHKTKAQHAPPAVDLGAQIAIRLSHDQLDEIHGALRMHNDVTGRSVDRSQFLRDVILAALHGTAMPAGVPAVRKAG